jgi:hypothetical protein
VWRTIQFLFIISRKNAKKYAVAVVLVVDAVPADAADAVAVDAVAADAVAADVVVADVVVADVVVGSDCGIRLCV